MTKQSLSFAGKHALIALALAVSLSSCSGTAPESGPVVGIRNVDASGAPAEMPTTIFNDTGGVTARFSAEGSPQIEKWWNGNLRITCPVGYHIEITSRADPSIGTERDEGMCAPNRHAD